MGDEREREKDRKRKTNMANTYANRCRPLVPAPVCRYTFTNTIFIYTLLAPKAHNSNQSSWTRSRASSPAT